jgi:superfamily II DNA or RNA helicase
MGKLTLYPHQVKGVEYLVNRRRGYLFITMRGGKTLTSLRSFCEMEGFPLLILTLKSIFQTWKKQLVQDGMDEKDIVYIQGTKEKKKKLLANMPRVAILNYESIKSLDALGSKYPWGGIIFDESYKLGNLSSGITNYCLSRVRHHDNIPVAMLSGSPASESAINLVPQYFICDGHFMGYHSMAQYLHKNWRYCPFSHKWKTKVAHEKAIRQYVEETAYCYIAKLSEKIYTKYHVPMNKKQRKAIEWAYSKTQDMDRIASAMGKSASLGKMLYVMYENMVCAGIDPQTKEVISVEKQKAVIQMYKDRPRPLLVLSMYSKPLYEMVELARKAGIPCAYIDGSVDSKTAHRIENMFNSGKIKILVAQEKVVKFGLDFKVSDTTIYLNNSFSLDDRTQSEQRTSNLTKEGGVEIIDMCTEGGIDEKVVDKLSKKEVKAKGFIDHDISSHLASRGVV